MINSDVIVFTKLCQNLSALTKQDVVGTICPSKIDKNFISIYKNVLVGYE